MFSWMKEVKNKKFGHFVLISGLQSATILDLDDTAYQDGFRHSESYFMCFIDLSQFHQNTCTSVQLIYLPVALDVKMCNILFVFINYEQKRGYFFVLHKKSEDHYNKKKPTSLKMHCLSFYPYSRQLQALFHHSNSLIQLQSSFRSPLFHHQCPIKDWRAYPPDSEICSVAQLINCCGVTRPVFV